MSSCSEGAADSTKGVVVYAVAVAFLKRRLPRMTLVKIAARLLIVTELTIPLLLVLYFTTSEWLTVRGMLFMSLCVSYSIADAGDQLVSAHAAVAAVRFNHQQI